MRKSFLAISIGFLLLVLLVATADIGFARYAPLHPGQNFFFVQKFAERSLLPLTLDRNAQANYVMDLVERRLGDLRLAQGTTGEVLALDALYEELQQDLPVLASNPNQATAGLRNRLVALLGNIQYAMAGLTIAPAQDSQHFNMLQELVTASLIVANDPTRPLDDILAGAKKIAGADGGGSSAPTPTLAPSQVPTEIAINPQLVQFPPGSPGAVHAFFPLTGKHAAIDCSACHGSGIYTTVPTSCTTCHADVIPQNHYQAECKACHTTDAWLPATFDHQAVDTSDCASCHTKDEPAAHYPGQCSVCHVTDNWQKASFDHSSTAATDCTSCHTKDAPAGHYAAQCSACHSTVAWQPASFSHSVIDAANCTSCHTKDAPANHYSGQCSQCHNTSAWLPATFNHAAQNATNCTNCHSSDAPANHYSGQCSQCHSVNAWKPATFNHAAQNATNCTSCHTNDAPANHYSGQCSQCHNVNAWKPATFNHTAQNATNCTSCHTKDAPANHYSGQCSQCHSTSAWRPATFNHSAQNATDCVSCHSKDAPANHYSGQCSQCHNTSSWAGASFDHTFPINHGGANGQCSTCHPSGTDTWTCFGCHSKAQLDSHHSGIPNYTTRCMECHPTGRTPGD